MYHPLNYFRYVNINVRDKMVLWQRLTLYRSGRELADSIR